MITADCPLCGEGIDLGMILKFGQRLHCSACEAVLEVSALSPIKLDWLYFDQYINEGDYNDIKHNRLATCPRCQHEFNTSSRLRLGQCVLCPACDAELEVVWLDPIELNWPYGEGCQHLRDDYQDDLNYISEEV
jgi:alpha-aminoadipate/glutamate carrier protein LysW